MYTENRDTVDVASRLLSSNYVKNTSTALQLRRQLCDGLSFNTQNRTIMNFQNIMRLGYIKDVVVMAWPYIALAATGAAVTNKLLCLQGSLKQVVNKCDIWLNSELVCSESNLEPYFGMCEQLKSEWYEDESLSFC